MMMKIYIKKNQFNELEIGSHQSIALTHKTKITATTTTPNGKRQKEKIERDKMTQNKT